MFKYIEAYGDDFFNLIIAVVGYRLPKWNLLNH